MRILNLTEDIIEDVNSSELSKGYLVYLKSKYKNISYEDFKQDFANVCGGSFSTVPIMTEMMLEIFEKTKKDYFIAAYLRRIFDGRDKIDVFIGSHFHQRAFSYSKRLFLSYIELYIPGNFYKKNYEI